jgi:hypothetical protein
MSCPPSEALVSAADPGASRDVREGIADHLITCTRCAEEFRVLQELGPWASEHAHLIDAAHPTRATTRRFGSMLRFGSTWAYAAAAVLVLAVAALEVQVRRLQQDNRTLTARAESAAAAAANAARPPADLERRLAEQQRSIADLEQRLRSAEAPDLNAAIIDLEPADAARSATASPTPAVAATSGRSIVFVLNTTRPAAGASYEVDLVGAGNRVLWTGSGLTQTADRTLTLVAPRTLVSDARQLRLYSRAGSRRTLVEEYAVPQVRR